MEKLKIGFIGCGGIANDKHFPGMATQRDRIDMYAFCGPRPPGSNMAVRAPRCLPITGSC